MKNDIAVEKLKELLNYNPVTGIFTWKQNRRGKARSGDVAGSVNDLGYLKISVIGKNYAAHRLAWLYVYGKWPSKFIDHIDRNKLNNSIDNLREATRYENGANVGIKSHNTSGFIGVSYNAQWRKWFAQIIHKGNKTFLGYYKTPELASEAYQKAAKEKFGEYSPN
ncbi:HNH endonuclease signature motif containing protein [Serratia quinivorans]|uniref:HNH endonuclease signature motif containing protein n=1 Tax=Serratia quinivorans TaxID=137545 RepID=UPI003F9D7C6A